MNTDIASGLEKRLAGSVDVIVVNPPYVPTPEYEVGMEEKGWFYLVTLISNFPAEISLMMREKGYSAGIVVQRSTEEENILILKFLIDKDEESQDKEISSSSFVSQFSKSISSLRSILCVN
ncbi:PREDICTED: uncharacterized protein LOC104709778 [Camelina sativa]|uniref:Uncharacterized protein LOC104709778 n=1 Tax=Camelina sativa TaxID=90675 RepID=A0ABM0TDB0_CAMSA|nr:PREDICTED: uncharacterized protein LOC104709778 [Camelina sativa]